MTMVRKFLSLSWSERQTLLLSACLLVVVRIATWVLPFSVVRRLATRASADGPEQATSHTSEQIVWGVAVASRHLPMTDNCLVRALTTQMLLGRQNIPANVQIGVARDGSGHFAAHAWVESGGKVLIGGEGIDQFTHLMSLEEGP